MPRSRLNWGVVGYLVEMFGLALWVGGLVVIIGVVIPAVFNSFGMEPAGRFLRRVFDGYGYLNVGIVLMLFIMAGIRSRIYSREANHLFSVSRGEWMLLTAMLLVTASILGVVGPRAVTLQEAAFEAASKPEKEAAFAEFFRLHMIVRGLHLINVGLAATLLVTRLRRAVMGCMTNGFEPGEAVPRLSRTGRGAR